MRAKKYKPRRRVITRNGVDICVQDCRASYRQRLADSGREPVPPSIDEKLNARMAMHRHTTRKASAARESYRQTLADSHPEPVMPSIDAIMAMVSRTGCRDYYKMAVAAKRIRNALADLVRSTKTITRDPDQYHDYQL